MSTGPARSGVQLATSATAAIERGEPALGAALALEAADAFLGEQGEPNFDAPNMLRLCA